MLAILTRFLCFLIVIAMFSCSGSLPDPTPDQIEWASKRWPQTDMSTLQSGKRIYTDKCSGCHGVKNPAHYTAIQWESIMVKMGKKAKLKTEEFEVISRYLITLSKK